jgi:hypothetical protein
MLFNPTEVCLGASPQSQHNKNKMQLTVIWNNQGEQSLNESSPAWLNNLKQTTSEATLTCNNTAHMLNPACVKCKNKKEKRFQLLHPDTSIAADISRGKCFIIQTSTNTRARTFPKYKIKKSITYTDGSSMQDETSKQQILGAGIFTPTTGTGYSDATTNDPGDKGPTLTIFLMAYYIGQGEIANSLLQG